MTDTDSIYANAAAPKNANGTITISFGLLNIELGVYTGTQETRVSRKEFFRGDANIPVGRTQVRKDTGETIDKTDVTRMAQATNGAWVEITDDEVAAVTQPKGIAEIEAFVPLSDIGRYSAENVAQLRPKMVKSVPNPATSKAFALLLTAMETKGVAALTRVALRGPARPALLMPNGNLVYIRTADAVRETLPLPTPSFSDAELAMAGMLIDTVGIDTPVVVDETAPLVAALVEAKAEGVEVPEAVKATSTPVDNLMAALEASIKAAAA